MKVFCAGPGVIVQDGLVVQSQKTPHNSNVMNTLWVNILESRL
jgi:hypothetical protein